jgi:wobble nucleotide-excising tRNase
MGKLTRVTKLRHRVFRDFTWPKELLPFAQFNVIYGWNGCGKTTLSSLLARVQKNTALTEGEVELEFDGETKISGADLPSSLVPPIRVFNSEFVNATLSATGGIAPIYFLGEDSVEKQREVEQLKRQLETAKEQVASWTSTKASVDKQLDNFCVERARSIKQLLISGKSPDYNNYDKSKFRKAVEGLTPQRAVAATLSDEQKESRRKEKEAQLKGNIDKVTAPAVDLVDLTNEVNTLISRSVVAQTLDELKQDPKLAAWVETGLSLHSGEHNSDTCHFCQKPFERTRRAALEGHFNDAFASLLKEASALLKKLQTAKQSVTSLQLPDASRFYDRLTQEAQKASESVSSVRSKTCSTLDALVACVESKRANPFAPAMASPNCTTTPPFETCLVELNAIVEKHNQTSKGFKASVERACKSLEASYVAEAFEEFSNRAAAVKNAQQSLDNVKSKPSNIQRQIYELERDILEHRRPAEELTKDLSEYLGRDELRFEVKDTGYALMRGEQPVSNLSDGERTSIAFLYFLKSLQDKDFNMANGIVVIDDPVSSLDANALFSAFGYMKERTEACGQLFIFTHSFPFLRNVKNWFKYLNRDLDPKKPKKTESCIARFFQLRSHQQTDGLRTSEIGQLDPLLQKYESEYQYLFKQVYSEAHNKDGGTLEHRYGLPNVARRLLEAFLAFRFPDMSGDLKPRLDRVIYDTAKKTSILRFLNTYSHAEALLEPDHDLSQLSETERVLPDLLDLMRSIDKDHYEGLERAVNPAPR